MFTRLADPALYIAAFEQVAARERDRHSEEAALEGAPPLASLAFQIDALAKRLAELVPSWRYELSPVVPRRVLIEGKSRVLYHSPPLDVVVMTAVASALGRSLEPTFSERLFSYRVGRSNTQAVLQLSAFIKAHRAQRPDPRDRGLYVLRRDVKAYGDAIPSGSDSHLWVALRRDLASTGMQLDAEAWEWLRHAIRPPVASREGFNLDPARGIPTGSPLQPLMGNLYLGDLDRACEAVEAGFYARYGDDILFAHAEPMVAQAVALQIDSTIETLDLTWSRDKCASLYVTAAGRSSRTDGFKGATALSYLGLRVDGRGEVGLSSEKASRLLRDIDTRLAAARTICGDASFEERAATYCGVVNASFDPTHPTADRAAQSLRRAVTDRAQLRDLDYQLALRVAELLTGTRGPRAFRKVSMRELRRAHGLMSLVVERNRVTRPRAAS